MGPLGKKRFFVHRIGLILLAQKLTRHMPVACLAIQVWCERIFSTVQVSKSSASLRVIAKSLFW